MIIMLSLRMMTKVITSVLLRFKVDFFFLACIGPAQDVQKELPTDTGNSQLYYREQHIWLQPEVPVVLMQTVTEGGQRLFDF